MYPAARLPRPLLLLALPLLVAVVLLAAPASGADAPTHYIVDKGHSALLFKIKHLGVSYTHGRFNDFNGFFTVDDANLKNARIEIDIDAASIDSNSKDRDDHLRGKEYFNVEEHPSISFESTSITKAGDDTYRVTGTFTLLGKAKEITFRMKKIGEGDDPWGGHRLGYEGQLVIKRSEFGMTTMLKGIGDDVYITLGVEGIRKDPAQKK